MILRKITLSSFLFFFSISTFAEGLADWYRVDIGVFIRSQPELLSEEYWDREQPSHRITQGIELQPVNPDLTDIVAFRELPTTSSSVQQAMNKIEGLAHHRVVLLKSWYQPIEENKSYPVHISGGPLTDQGNYLVDGYLTFSRGRYLHLRPELDYTRQIAADEQSRLLIPASAKSEIEIDLSSISSQPADQGIFGERPSKTGDPTINPQPLDLTPISGLSQLSNYLTFRIDQPRRMRSNELHYLDHPMFGLLIYIKRLQEN